MRNWKINLITCIFILGLFTSVVTALPIHQRKYGVQATIPFVLYEVDGIDFRVDAADAGADCTISKDEGAETTCTNDFTDEGTSYSLVLTATEMQAARIVVTMVDTATKVWLDTGFIVETYGNASANLAPQTTASIVTDALSKAQVQEGLVPINTTIAAYTSNTSFTLTSGPTDDSAIVGWTCTIVDQSDSEQMAAGIISAYTTAANTVTLDADPLAAFTFANGDLIYISPTPRGIDVKATLTDTEEIGTAGAGLTNINLPNQTMDITGDITGNLSGSVGSVSGAVGSVAGNVDGNVSGSVASVTNGATAAKLTAYTQLLARSDAAIATDNATELTAINADGGSGIGDYDNTTDAQEALSAGTSAAAIADAVLDEAVLDHTTSGTLGWYIRKIYQFIGNL